MDYRLFLGIRHLRSRKRKFLSFATFISTAGIALGVAAIIVVMGVMNGFTEEVRRKILGLKSHLIVEMFGSIPSPYPVMEKIEKVEGVIASSPVVWGEAIIKYKGHARGIIIKGVDYEREVKVTDLGNYVKDKKIPSLVGGVLIGNELAKSLGLYTSDNVLLISPDLESQEFQVIGTFNSGMFEYDNSLIFLSAQDAQELLGLRGEYSGIQVKVEDVFASERIKRQLTQVLGPLYRIRTWQEMDRTFYYALKLEKIAMFAILALIVVVASFNIASTLAMMVMEKRRQIGILRALGATSKDIRRIFLYQGLIIGFSGTVLGCLGGLLLGILLGKYRFISLPEEIYYISSLPVSLEGHVFALVSLVALVISLLATIYPAYRASRLQVGETLRYE
ncbi:MAG TPA: ABC transporter permease [Candidatus Omnitrophica bacterium]|nr:ABC transporter permease [Candidatus Omnitrophota bacterium]